MKANKLILSALGAMALAAQTFAQDSTATNAPVTKPAAEESRPAAEPLRDGEKGLRLNFRGAPLEQVLNYMSDAAGFIINVLPNTDIKGKVDVWTNQPLDKEEAVQLLNTILHQNGLAAIRTGRTLSIISRDTAKTNKDVPVRVLKGEPDKIPRSDEMVTQIIPVKYVNAAALVQNLQPLLPEYAQNGLSANEAGNSLILTASQTDVRRMAEIVAALDQAISNVSEIKVFQLKFADAKTLVDAVKELFTPPAQQNQNQAGRGQLFQNLFGGGGGPFGGGGPGGGRGGFPNGGNFGGNNSSRGNTSASAARVVAVADERSNSLIIAAASDAMPEIDRLVKEIDIEVDEVTEIRLFPLTNSDPNDVVEILTQLFPDPTSSNQQQGGRFGGFRGGFGGGGQFGRFNRGQQTTPSERASKQSRVISVADARTSSVIVTAARDVMPEIEKMIRQLDANRRGRQRVYVYNLENADVTQVEQVVRDMFDRSNNGRNNNQQQSALTSRQQQTIQQQGLNTGVGAGQGTRGGNNLGGQFGQ